MKCLSAGEVSHTWVLESRVSLHVTPHKEWFTTYKETIGSARLGESYECDIVGIGDITMVMASGATFSIHNICHAVPSLTCSLILVGCLDDFGYKIIFHQQYSRITKGNVLIANGSKVCSLYPLIYLTKLVFSQ